MKNLLKKLSGAGRGDRREALETDAAERIREVSGQPPADAYASSWGSSTAPEPQPATETTHDAEPGLPVDGGGRRLTVQERMAARELQNR